MGNSNTVILDCYTDEPSGFGVRPYLGTHQLHLSQALSFLGKEHYYLTIDDLRFCEELQSKTFESNTDTNLRILNRTKNFDKAIDILRNAKVIFIIMGCFVDYNYFSTKPPKSDEVYNLLKDFSAEKILFYVLGTSPSISPDYHNSKLKTIINHVEFGNTYRYILEQNCHKSLLEPNYNLLSRISSAEPQIIHQLRYPIISEIETGAGCNTPFCYFCIESARPITPSFRMPNSIITQIKTLYSLGVRHFRLGKQPNFYYYQKQDTEKIKELLQGIRENCPEIEMLHIDNANIINVASGKGREITKLIVDYCTSGNIAALGVETFDDTVRKRIRKVGNADLAMRAIEIINEFGSKRGDDGLPIFLPGINLIYGLPGQSEKTHILNLEYLKKFK